MPRATSSGPSPPPPWSSRTLRPPRTPIGSGPTGPSTCGASRTAPPRRWTPSAPATSPSRAPRPPRASRAGPSGPSGGSTSKGYTTFAEPKPDAVTLEAWVKTTSGNGGRIIGLGSSAGNSSSSYDLALYLGNNGRVNLGVRNAANSLVTTTSTQAVNDGQWHHVVGVVDAGGSSIVIDGRRSGRNQNGTGGPALQRLLAGPRRQHLGPGEPPDGPGPGRDRRRGRRLPDAHCRSTPCAPTTPRSPGSTPWPRRPPTATVPACRPTRRTPTGASVRPRVRWPVTPRDRPPTARSPGSPPTADPEQ